MDIAVVNRGCRARGSKIGVDLCLQTSLELVQKRNGCTKLINKGRRQVANSERGIKQLADTADLVWSRAVVRGLAVVGNAVLQVRLARFARALRS